MIPKILHVLWFGNKPIPEKIEKIIYHNKEVLGPSWEIKIWRDKDFDISKNTYTKHWYEKKQWSFVSDYYRGYVLQKYGGFYVDTDIVLSKSLDSLTKYKYVASRTYVVDNTMSIVGAEPNSEIINTYMKLFKNKKLIYKPPRIMATHYHTYALRKFMSIPDQRSTYINKDVAIFSEDILQIKINSNNIAIHEHHDNWTGDSDMSISKWYSKKVKAFNSDSKFTMWKRIQRRNRILKKIDKYCSNSSNFVEV